MEKKDRFFLVSNGSGTMRRYPENPNTDHTDRFRLLVFSPAGKITAAKKLDVFCDAIYVHEESLFILDTYMGMKIYEYRVNFDN